MEATLKDKAQDELIAQNAERILRNEEAIKRQTEALEQIRDHYYPPPESFLKKCFGFAAKVVCVIVAYLGIAETVDWIWSVRESEALAANYAKVANRLFLKEGNASGAVQCYEKALALDEGNSDYLSALTLMKGMSLSSDLLGMERPLTDEERNRLDLATADATMMEASDPDNPLPHVLMAQTLMLKGDREAAIGEIDRAVACAPENASVRISACAMSFFAGQFEASKKHLAEAERLEPDLPLVACWKGMHALSLDHDATSAVAHFRTMTVRSPRLALGHAMTGRALLAGAKPDVKSARASFERALTLNAKSTVAVIGMAETFEREGNLPVARLWLDQAIATDANYLKALVARARIFGKLNDWKSAVDDLTAAVAIDRFRVDLYRLRAEAYDKVGDAASAKSDRAMAEALGEKK